MRALVTRLLPDGRREKLLVTDWPDPPAPVANQVRTRTLTSGITNGTERNDLIGGNYATPDDRLPAGWGYQNVGEVVECGPECRLLAVGDVIYSSAGHDEFTTVAEDWLLVKLPPEIDRREAALFGMASVAMRTCRNADLRMGERALVVGAGFIGQMAAQIAAAMGARVSLCDVDEHRLEQAREIGAAECAFNSGGEGWAANVPPASFDAVIDLAGVPGMEDRLIEAVLCAAGCFSSPAAARSSTPSTRARVARSSSSRTATSTAATWPCSAGSWPRERCRSSRCCGAWRPWPRPPASTTRCATPRTSSAAPCSSGSLTAEGEKP
ncbi:MAG: zinc-binding dehydrogenase [Armatimonadetes bacterium]|nr:zinc-binding dehydrogenase [Armatimonadota bacterium]